jgi:hypothetical protein
VLSKNIGKYFLSLDASSSDLARDPFVLSSFESAELTVAEEDELIEISNHRRLKLKHSTDMVSFWMYLRQEHPIITKKAIEAFLPFSTPYLGDTGFSAMNMKSKNPSQLPTLKEDLSVCLSIVRHRTRDITRHHQAQISH